MYSINLTIRKSVALDGMGWDALGSGCGCAAARARTEARTVCGRGHVHVFGLSGLRVLHEHRRAHVRAMGRRHAQGMWHLTYSTHIQTDQ